jgi:hypothetical protein
MGSREQMIAKRLEECRLKLQQNRSMEAFEHMMEALHLIGGQNFVLTQLQKAREQYWAEKSWIQQQQQRQQQNGLSNNSSNFLGLSSSSSSATSASPFEVDYQQEQMDLQLAALINAITISDTPGFCFFIIFLFLY